jgi:pimeloyl-ACP methyl ester carboxylesterase
VRGYGGSSCPPEAERYTLRDLAGDVAAVAAELSDEPILLFGHDWGAPIVWTTAVRHPERVRAVAGLSVPYTPALPISLIDLFDQIYADRFFYMLHFQPPGVVEAEFAADLRAAFKRIYFTLSGLAPVNSFLPDIPRRSPLLASLPEPAAGPLPFLDDEQLDACVAAFERTGMVGAFNRYRAMAFDPDTSADIAGATVDQPSCFVAGSLDAVRSFIPGVDAYRDPGAASTDFRGATIIEGVGHWVQQEAPERTNAALEAFLATL